MHNPTHTAPRWALLALAAAALFGTSACADDATRPEPAAADAHNASGAPHNAATSSTNAHTSTSTTGTTNGTTTNRNNTTTNAAPVDCETTPCWPTARERDAHLAPSAWTQALPRLDLSAASATSCDDSATPELTDPRFAHASGAYMVRLDGANATLDADCAANTPGAADAAWRAARVRFTAPTSGLWRFQSAPLPSPPNLYTDGPPNQGWHIEAISAPLAPLHSTRAMQLHRDCDGASELACATPTTQTQALPASAEDATEFTEPRLNAEVELEAGASVWITLTGCASDTPGGCAYALAAAPILALGAPCDRALDACAEGSVCTTQDPTRAACVADQAPELVAPDDPSLHTSTRDAELGHGRIAVTVRDPGHNIAWLAYERLNADGSPRHIIEGVTVRTARPRVTANDDGTLRVEVAISAWDWFPAEGEHVRVWVIDSAGDSTAPLVLTPASSELPQPAPDEACDTARIQDACADDGLCVPTDGDPNTGRCVLNAVPRVLDTIEASAVVGHGYPGGEAPLSLRIAATFEDADADLRAVSATLLDTDGRIIEPAASWSVRADTPSPRFAWILRSSRWHDALEESAEPAFVVLQAFDRAGHASEEVVHRLTPAPPLHEGDPCGYTVHGRCAEGLACATASTHDSASIAVCANVDVDPSCPESWDAIRLDASPDWRAEVDLSFATQHTATSCMLDFQDYERVFAFTAPEARTYTVHMQGDNVWGHIYAEARTLCTVAATEASLDCAVHRYLSEDFTELLTFTTTAPNETVYIVVQANGSAGGLTPVWIE